MSVFKIKVHGQPSAQPGPEGEAQAEAPIVAAEPSTGEQVPSPTMEDGQAVLDEKKPEKMVKIDGPIGRIFTDALNRLLATEGYITMLPVEEFENTPVVEDALEMTEVYCWTGNTLNTTDVTELMNNVTRHQDRQFVVAVESVQKVTPLMGLLDSMVKLPNVQVCYSREAALAAVRKVLG